MQNPLPTAVANVGGILVYVNDAFCQMSRRTREQLIGCHSVSLIHADDLACTVIGLERLDSGAAMVRQQRRHRRGDDTWAVNDVVMSFLNVDGERQVLVQVIHHTDAAAEDICLDDEAKTRLVLQVDGDLSCFHNANGEIVYTNNRCVDLLGVEPTWLRGRRLTDAALSPIAVGGRPLGEADDPVLEALRTGVEVTRTMGFRCSDLSPNRGEMVWMSVRASPTGTDTYSVRTSMRDITELIRAQEEARYLSSIVEQELTYRADHDSLTGLKARHAVIDVIDDRLREGLAVSVVFVDLDKFKEINDTYGHMIGDEVLIGVAKRLTDLGGESLAIGRTGGDEFVAVFGEADAAAAFCDAASLGSLTSGALPLMSASVGTAHAERGDSSRELLRRADDQMYLAKRNRRQRRDGGVSLPLSH